MVRDILQNETGDHACNVLGGPLEACGFDPVTGFFRDGHCHTCAQDHGSHTVCVVVTEEFLNFSQAMGNDLITPVPQFRFPGLRHGDHWCLCAARWLEAAEAGCAPRVVLESTHEAALGIVPLELLREHAF